MPFPIGKDSGKIEDSRQMTYCGVPEVMSAIPETYQTLWDIKDKKPDVPVYKLAFAVRIKTDSCSLNAFI
jgi:L-alanine-DL-glutamate epimerase-like enolase superfamily enzyme